MVCALLVALALALILQRILVSPAGLVIFHDPRAPWIGVDETLGLHVQQWGRERIPITRFSASFQLPEGRASSGHIEVRALREYAIELDGEPLTQPLAAIPASAFDLRRDWKTRARLALPEGLSPGAHSIAVEVRNPLGPALLSLRLVDAGVAFSTADPWEARRDAGEPLPTARARERPVDPAALEAPSTGQALVSVRLPLAGFALLGVMLLAAARALAARPAGAAWLAGPWPVRLAFAALALYWLALLVTKFRLLPLATGFDAGPHLRYLDFLRVRQRLPLATDGWAMYHPPLFYLASDLVARAVSLHSLIPPLKLVPALAGAGTAWLCGALTRRLLPGDRRALLFAVGLGAVLPMNCYIAGYFTNEGLHAFLATALLFVAVGLLQRDTPPARTLALFSTLVGLALLTKQTAFVIGGVAGLFVLVRTLQRGDDAPRTLARLALLGGPLLLVAGWYYLYTWIELGNPLLSGWDPRGPRRIWWSAPGFHTAGYFVGFGESLVRPFLAGHHSFLDGLYSTLWGDGQLAGRTSWALRHGRWDYTFMAAGYPLALPATGLAVAGALRLARLAWREEAPGRRAALGLPLAVAAAMLFLLLLASLQAPGVSQVKAFYALAAAGPWVLCFGAGAGALDRWLDARGWQPARLLLAAWFAALVGCLAASFLA